MAATTVGKTALQLQGDARPLEADMAKAEKTVAASAGRMNKDLQKAGKGFEIKNDTLSKMGLMFAGKAWLDQLTNGNAELNKMIELVGKVALGFAIGGPIGAGIAGLIVLVQEFGDKISDAFSRPISEDTRKFLAGMGGPVGVLARESLPAGGDGGGGQFDPAHADRLLQFFRGPPPAWMQAFTKFMPGAEDGIRDFGNVFKGVFIEDMETGIARAKEMADEQKKLADDAEATAREIRTPLQVFQDRMRDLQRQAAEGFLSQEEMDRAAGLAAERLRGGLPQLTDPGSLKSAQVGSAEAIAALNRFRRGQEGPGADKLNVVAELMKQDATRQQRNTRILEDILGQLQAEGEQGIFE